MARGGVGNAARRGSSAGLRSFSPTDDGSGFSDDGLSPKSDGSRPGDGDWRPERDDLGPNDGAFSPGVGG